MDNNSQFEIFAKTFHGLEDVLTDELASLGARNISKQIRGAKFIGDNSLLYKVNYHSRYALNFLKYLFSFKTNNPDLLYKKIIEYPWEKIFNLNKTFAVESTVNSKYFDHSKYVALKTKDAIVDRFRKIHNQRPNVNTYSPDILIHIHINNDICTVSLNSSGEPLYKRGYRTDLYKAPINEVLAAGMLALSNWDKKSDLIDPMCGSGTLLIEAAMLAIGIPAGKYRRKFAFQSWNDYNDNQFQIIKKTAEKKKVTRLHIIGIDISKEALKAAQNNIKNAQLEGYIKLINKDFLKYTHDKQNGVIITNPPYGKRINNEDINNLYRETGNHLKRNFMGFNAWILSNNIEAVKYIGLKPTKKLTLFNGPLECKFYNYSIFKGSHKEFKSKNN